MRPRPILYFERLYLATLLIGVLQAYLNWDQTYAAVAKLYPNPVPFIVVTQVFSYAVTILLVLLVSRRRSKIAMWISIVLFVIGLPTVVGLMTGGSVIGTISPLSALTMVIQMVGQFVAFGLLFTRSGRRWMNRQEEPDELRETFS